MYNVASNITFFTLSKTKKKSHSNNAKGPDKLQV